MTAFRCQRKSCVSTTGDVIHTPWSEACFPLILDMFLEKSLDHFFQLLV